MKRKKEKKKKERKITGTIAWFFLDFLLETKRDLLCSNTEGLGFVGRTGAKAKVPIVNVQAPTLMERSTQIMEKLFNNEIPAKTIIIINLLWRGGNRENLGGRGD